MLYGAGTMRKNSQGKNEIRVFVSLLKAPHWPQRTWKVSFRWIGIRQSCTSIQHTPRTMLYCTKGIDFIATSDSKIGTDITLCNHEEADTLLIFHALHCAKHGHCRILNGSVDTDVVLSIATFHVFTSY